MKLSRLYVVFIAPVALAAGATLASYAAPLGLVFVGTAKVPISVTAGDYDLVAQVVDVAPGGAIPKHYHPGPAVVQVLTGEITMMDTNGQKAVKAGGMFTENPGNVIWGANKGSVPVRMMASYLIPRGKDIATLVK